MPFRCLVKWRLQRWRRKWENKRRARYDLRTQQWYTKAFLDGPGPRRGTESARYYSAIKDRNEVPEHVIRFIVFLDRGSWYTRIYSWRRVAYVNTKIDKASGSEDGARQERSKIDKGRWEYRKAHSSEILGAKRGSKREIKDIVAERK